MKSIQSDRVKNTSNKKGYKMEFKLLVLEKAVEWLVGGDLFKFIQKEVGIMNDTDLSGEEKRKAVQEEAKRFFGDTATFFVNLAIEVAVVLLKAKLGELQND